MLQVNETARYTDIPTKIFKENFDLISDFIQILMMYCSVSFSNSFKVGCDVTQIYRKDSKSSREYERPGIFY